MEGLACASRPQRGSNCCGLTDGSPAGPVGAPGRPRDPGELGLGLCSVKRQPYSVAWEFDTCPAALDWRECSLEKTPDSETPSSYGYDLEENARGHDDSPPSSPRLRSKSRSSRDTQSSGSLESTLSVELDLEKGLEMRKWVLSGILASEEAYISQLEALLIPMKPLRAAATTSQPVLTIQQIETIFFKVPELHEIHKDFYDALLPRVQDWGHQQCVGDLFQKLASQLGVYRAFVDNYKVAVETADKCCQANAKFAEISENLKVKSSKDFKDQSAKNSLENLLYKPVDRVTRSTLVLHVSGPSRHQRICGGFGLFFFPIFFPLPRSFQDLLKHTPSSHPDYLLLQDALRISQNFLSSINEEITPRRQSMTVKKGETLNPTSLKALLSDWLCRQPSESDDPTELPDLPDRMRVVWNSMPNVARENRRTNKQPPHVSATLLLAANRQLLRDRFMVELVEGSRKLRHVFLFTDLLLCAKLKKQAAGKGQQYDCKWYVPLADLTFQTIEDCESTPIPLVQDEEIDAMKIKISQIKNEIQREKVGSRMNESQERTTKGPKAIERLRKRLSEQESLLLLMSPNMAFRVANRNGKGFTFLISSDYERAEWREIIREQQKKCFKSFSLTSLELQMLTNSCVKLQTVHTIPVTMNKEEDESSGLYGFLNVIVHSATGLKQSLNLYCSLEVDSFGYFVNKAKTRVYRDSTEPNWNEEFEIELEGSQTLRLLCYEKSCSKTRQRQEDGEMTDKIVAKGQIKLDPQTLQNRDWQRSVIGTGGIDVKLSMKFTSREFSLKRMPSRKQSGVFGVKINVVTKWVRSLLGTKPVKQERDGIGLIRPCPRQTGALEGPPHRATVRGGDRAARDGGGGNLPRVGRGHRHPGPEGCLRFKQQRRVHADAGDGRERHRRDAEAVLPRVAGASLHRRAVPELRRSHRSVAAAAAAAMLARLLTRLISSALCVLQLSPTAWPKRAACSTCCCRCLNLTWSPSSSSSTTSSGQSGYGVSENESVNKMSLHNLATVFGPTLLRPSEKDSKIPNSSQPISMNDSWSLEVMAQVGRLAPALVGRGPVAGGLTGVSAGAGPPLLPPAGRYSSARQQAPEPALLYRSMTANPRRWAPPGVLSRGPARRCFTLRTLKLATRWSLAAASERPKQPLGANVHALTEAR
ncbi:unnamed protein product [Tetraodon nigroviridis]|uniref:(spotted green pufferfish) hypothetical protein n=1 Tax=Tetraodon nigroviridis TaxID=99883 RepID=Q4SA62_TETNG|nr:unnamed protein product [Tetraodon nigroviridis]